MNQKDNDQWEIGLVVVVGFFAAALGIDLAGRLFTFLSGEAQYMGIGLVIGGFYYVNFLVRSSFKKLHEKHQKDVEEKLAEYKKRLLDVDSDYDGVRGEIKFMHKTIERHWSLCEKTINKAEEVLKQKTPVIIEPQPVHQPTEESVLKAIEEVVGDAI
jgi:hypothetical protein